MNNTILLKNKQNVLIKIEYQIIRSSRKTCSIVLNEDGTLTLRIPAWLPESEIEHLLMDKQHWITEKLSEQKKQLSRRPANDFTDRQRMVLEARYKEAAKQYIPNRVAFYLTNTELLSACSYERITIRNQKTRWGSCSSHGTLSFNWRLMLAPPGILDYVVVHELCHLLHMNHSPAFWDCVGSILPDYKVRRKWLREHGNELTLS